MSVIIGGVEAGSPAKKARIKAGSLLLSLNGHEIVDVLDYRFYQLEEKVTIEYLSPSGAHRKKKIKKAEEEELGLKFESYLMDKQRACRNKCVFCFIDQLPRGMRKSLYFKDDDSRLSFLFGNYITLTNLSEREIERIIRLHISPVNVSVHTTNPDLRVRMMGNPEAGSSLSLLSRFSDAGIALNCQLVIVPGLNDGEELRRSLRDLTALPSVLSVACVPVGLTRFRENLTKLSSFNKETASAVIDITEEFRGDGRVFAADEFFIKAERQMPSGGYYGDYPQLENGVGLWTSFLEETERELEICPPPEKPQCVSIATGEAAYPLIKRLVSAASEKWGNLDCAVYKIENEFFGKEITVAGLITGSDLLSQLSGKPLGERLIISEVMLQTGTDRFLDDMTVPELSKALGVSITVQPSGAAAFLSALKGETNV